MSNVETGNARPLRVFATALIVLCVAGSAWAQQRGQVPTGPYPNCDRQQAGNCTDAGVVACQNNPKLTPDGVRKCQMDINMQCNTQHGCPNSAQLRWAGSPGT